MTNAPLNVKTANALLRQTGLRGRFTEDLLAAALEKHRPSRIRDAIHRAPADRGAHQFLVNLIAGTDVPNRAAPGGRVESVATAAPHWGGRSVDGARRPVPRAFDALPATGSRPPLDDEFPPEHQDRGGRQRSRRTPRDAGRRPRRPSRADAGREPGRFPLTFKAYGRKAALEFRAFVAEQGYDTVMLEAASARGERRYDWGNKISVMMMQRELPEVAAVLLGALKGCEFRHHGPRKNKGFSIENQGGKFFVRVFRTGDERELHGVPVPFEDAFYIAALVLRQLGRAVRGADAATIVTALRAYARLKGSG